MVAGVKILLPSLSDSLSIILKIQTDETQLKMNYHKWSLTVCDGYFDTLKSSKM